MSEIVSSNPEPEGVAARANVFPWPPVLFAGAVLGGFAANRFAPLGWPGLDDAAAHFIGLAIGLGGLALITAAVLALRRHATTVMPHRASEVLVTTGPYRLLRNPIYLGEVMTLFGLAELTKNIWFVFAGLLFALLVTWLQILSEERHLEARFGDAYRDYKRHTRRWI